MRQVLAVLAAAAAAALGALILGEYELVGVMPYVAGALFGLAVAEIALIASRQPAPLVAIAAGASSAAGLVWAAWIAAGRAWGYVSGARWAGVAVGAVASVLWVRSSGRRARGSLDEPAPPPAE